MWWSSWFHHVLNNSKLQLLCKTTPLMHSTGCWLVLKGVKFNSKKNVKTRNETRTRLALNVLRSDSPPQYPFVFAIEPWKRTLRARPRPGSLNYIQKTLQSHMKHIKKIGKMCARMYETTSLIYFPLMSNSHNVEVIFVTTASYQCSSPRLLIDVGCGRKLLNFVRGGPGPTGSLKGKNKEFA